MTQEKRPVPLFENDHLRVWDQRLARDTERFSKPSIAILEGEALPEIRIAKWPDGGRTFLVAKIRLSDELVRATEVICDGTENVTRYKDKWLPLPLYRLAVQIYEEWAEYAHCISGAEAYRAMGIEIPKERGFPLPFLTR